MGRANREPTHVVRPTHGVSAEFASEICVAGEHALTLLDERLVEYGRRAAPHTSRANPKEARDAEGRA
jgi:hypothetical protein